MPNYTVKRGDTLGAIAKRNNTTVSELLSLNTDITDADKLQIGQNVHLPYKERPLVEALARVVPTTTDVDYLARTGFGEARGEGLEGMRRAMHVVKNRAGAGPIEPVVTAPKQFSAWNPGDPNRAKMLAVTEQDKDFAAALKLAVLILSGRDQDPTGGATHYFNPRAVRPEWAKAMESLGEYGQHVFLK